MDDPGNTLESAVTQVDDSGYGQELEPPRRRAVGQGLDAAGRTGAVIAEFLVLELPVARFTPGHATPSERAVGAPEPPGRE
jgi:hypothetical protein